MKKLRALDHLVAMRERERDRLGASLAEQQAQTRRCQHNLERVQALAADKPVTPHAALALNGVAYREALLRLADGQRAELLRHQAAEDDARQALHGAARRHETLNQLAEGQRERLALAQGQQTRRHEDELAGLAWQRGRT